jgi:hypothetical protein
VFDPNIIASEWIKMELMMDSFDSIVFNETYFWTLESFLGDFSGALGLWLGISFVNILRFLATLLISTQLSKIFEYKIKKEELVQKKKNRTKPPKRYDTNHALFFIH